MNPTTISKKEARAIAFMVYKDILPYIHANQASYNRYLQRLNGSTAKEGGKNGRAQKNA